MEEDYRRPIKVNRYWNRPKPKVYDCNMRDAERMYKDNYKEYLAAKDFRLRRDREWSVDTSDRFAHLRAGPVRRRDTSVQSRETSSTVESILQRVAQHKETAAKEAAEEEESAVTVKTERKPIPAYDPQKENQSLEERLNRLKRLREDLGLPQDTETSKTTLRDSRDSASRTFARDSASRTIARDSASRTLASDNDSSYKSERSSRLSSRTGAGATNDESSYSYRSERSAKVNGTDDFKATPTLERKTERKREEYNPSPKMERKSVASKAESSDDYSYKSEKKTDRYSKLSATTASSSSPGRTRKAVAATENVELDDEDDALMAKMMKKLPSSQEILERISKMDLDD